MDDVGNTTDRLRYGYEWQDKTRSERVDSRVASIRARTRKTHNRTNLNKRAHASKREHASDIRRRPLRTEEDRDERGYRTSAYLEGEATDKYKMRGYDHPIAYEDAQEVAEE